MRTPIFYCAIIAVLLFSTVSLPVGSPVSSAIGGVLVSLPGVSVVSEVDTFSLTQVRYSDLNIMIPAAFILLLVIIFRNGKRVLQLRVNAISTGFFLFVFVASSSACLSGEYIEALKLADYALVVIAYFSFDDYGKNRVRGILLSMCLIAGVMNAIVTIWQFGSMSGWVFVPSSIRLFRPDGLFGDSIISALFCSICIVVAFLQRPQTSLFIRIVVIALCLTAGVVTGARSFYYLLVIFGIYLLFAKTTNVSLGKKAVLLLGVVAVVAVVMSSMGQSLMDSLTFQDSVSSRDLKRQIAFDQFWNAPIFGIGTGQYANVEASLNMPTNSGLHGTNPHNVYLQVLCENGLIGFIPLMSSALALLVLVLKRKQTLAVVLLLLYFAIAWSLGILYSAAFTSFFIALVSSLVPIEDKV